MVSLAFKDGILSIMIYAINCRRLLRLRWRFVDRSTNGLPSSKRVAVPVSMLATERNRITKSGCSVSFFTWVQQFLILVTTGIRSLSREVIRFDARDLWC